MLRLLVDPSAAAIRTTPKDERDLIVSASNSHVLGFDNLSKVEGWLSDAFCRLSTGGGFATSTLHTDHDETVFDGQRPLLLNGISLLTNRADLADRALTINLRTLSEHDYLPEDELKAGFESARPRILGALLDAVSAAVRACGCRARFAWPILRSGLPPPSPPFVGSLVSSVPSIATIAAT